MVTVHGEREEVEISKLVELDQRVLSENTSGLPDDLT